jgi:ABC-2 type transport system ATP-binding protein
MTAIGLYGVSKTFRSYNNNRWLRRELVDLLSRKRKRGDRWELLRGVDLEIEEGETVAIVGRNGCGKSTLLRLMAGILQPNSGCVVRRGNICPLLDIGAGFHEDLTGRENVFVNGSILGLAEKYLKSILPEVEEFAELQGFMDTPLKFYSSGMRARLGFAVAMGADPDIFLIDEILAVGDEGFRRKCYVKLDEMISRRRTVVIVSHDTEAVQRLCARGVWLHEGTVRADGPIDEICRLYYAYFDEGEIPASSVGGSH